MPLASDPLPRDTMNLLAAVTSGRRARNPHARRDWMRVSQRLACGLTPRQVALAERTDEAAIDALLAQAGFRALVAAYEDFLALPPADAMAQLVKLARLALENALCDHDVGAALFVLREDKLHRDAAQTLAKNVLATSRRKHGSAAPPSPAPNSTRDPPLRARPPPARPRRRPPPPRRDRRARHPQGGQHRVLPRPPRSPRPVRRWRRRPSAATSSAHRLARQLRYGTCVPAAALEPWRPIATRPPTPARSRAGLDHP